MINIPDNPVDGQTVRLFEADSHGVTEYRYTYVRDKPCHEVINCAPGQGVRYYDEWYCERRSIPAYDEDVSSWFGFGRTTTENLKKSTVIGPRQMASFDEARAAAIAQMQDRIEDFTRQINDLQARIEQLIAIERLPNE